MLDLETYGTGANSALLAVGAVKFDPTTNEVGDSFYCVVDKQSCLDLGLEIDAATEEWWSKQSPEAKTVLGEVGEPLREVLLKFGAFCGEHAAMWGNGSDFDNAILASAYRKTKIEQPWKYFNNRCYRTMKSMFPTIKMKRVGVHHNAVDDARSQAIHLMAILEHMRTS